MTEKTHYKKSPHDERIEELALDIEAAKNKANKREHFWRCYAVSAAIVIFTMAGWAMKEGTALWGETLQVARLQEDRAANALERAGKQGQKIAQLHDELAAMEGESKRWQKFYAQEINRRREILGLSRELLITLHPKESQIPIERFQEWVNELESTKRREVAKLIVEAWRKQESRSGHLNMPGITTIEGELGLEK